jgi:hypothetical protein
MNAVAWAGRAKDEAVLCLCRGQCCGQLSARSSQLVACAIRLSSGACSSRVSPVDPTMHVKQSLTYVDGALFPETPSPSWPNAFAVLFHVLSCSHCSTCQARNLDRNGQEAGPNKRREPATGCSASASSLSKGNLGHAASSLTLSPIHREQGQGQSNGHCDTANVPSRGPWPWLTSNGQSQSAPSVMTCVARHGWHPTRAAGSLHQSVHKRSSGLLALINDTEER